MIDQAVPSWVDAYKQMQTAMAQQNGQTPAGYPRISNEQAASVLRYVMTASSKQGLSQLTANWYPVALALAGWTKPGDRFVLEPMAGAAEHRKAMLSDAATPVLWQLALGVATNMQQRGVPFAVPTLDPPTDYRAVLKQAWDRMQRENSDGSAPASAPASSTTLPEATKAPSSPSSGGNGLLILLAILVLSRGRI